MYLLEDSVGLFRCKGYSSRGLSSYEQATQRYSFHTRPLPERVRPQSCKFHELSASGDARLVRPYDGVLIEQAFQISSEEISNTSLEIFRFLGKRWKFLRTYHLILPKYHFILPKNFSTPTWGIFIPHGAIAKFLRGNWEQKGECQSFQTLIDY